MKASLDTNVLIHLYRAGKQELLYDFFKDGVIIYEQIRNVELENHGKDILPAADADIASGRLELFTDQRLKSLAVYNLFTCYVKENILLYSSKDRGEVFAISLAQTLGAYALVTDDIKQGGPYMSLMQLNIEPKVMPFNFADILLLRYLRGDADAEKTAADFAEINRVSGLNWSFAIQLKKFLKRFFDDPYLPGESEWMARFIEEYHVPFWRRIKELRNVLCA